MLSRLIPPVTPDNRLSAMFWGYLAFSAVYLGSYSLSAARAVYVPPSTWDLSVPLWPGSIWVYLSQTILLPAAFLSTDDAHDLTRAYRAMLSSTFLSGVIFLVWPTTVGQTVAPPTGVTGFAWTLLYSLDVPGNCFPSLHVALALIAAWLIGSRRRSWRYPALLWWAAISLSVLSTRQHRLIDIGGGIVVGMLSLTLTASSSCGEPDAA